MPKPAGAISVHYTVFAYDEDTGVEADASFDMQLTSDPDVIDVAAQIAADAARTHLSAIYPGVTVQCSRFYDCRRTGDPWPPVEEA